jgi:hypothetical protein
VNIIKSYEEFGNVMVADDGAGKGISIHIHRVSKVVVATRAKGGAVYIRIVTDPTLEGRGPQIIDLTLFSKDLEALKIKRVRGYVEMIEATA